jgi:hypothetical protein
MSKMGTRDNEIMGSALEFLPEQNPAQCEYGKCNTGTVVSTSLMEMRKQWIYIGDGDD